MSTKYFDLLTFQCRALNLPEPVSEFRFHPKRRWKFDCAWPKLDRRLAVEIEGVIFRGGHMQGRHVSVKGFMGDIEKYAEAAVLGWRVLRVMPKHVKDGRAVAWIEKLISQ